MRAVFRVLTAGTIGAVIALSGSAAFAKTTADCNAEYTANKAAIQAAKQKKGDFVKACLAGTETIPPAPAPKTTAKTPATTPAAAPAAAPATAPMTMPMPASAPATPPKPAPAAKTTPAPMAPVSVTEAAAQAKCPTGLVVWVNEKSKIYHFKGTKDYGTTKEGTAGPTQATGGE